jgi:DNA-binding protein YbaB
MSRFDQAKMLMRVKKIQKELEKQVITVEKGDGAVSVEITGESQRIAAEKMQPMMGALGNLGL